MLDTKPKVTGILVTEKIFEGFYQLAWQVMWPGPFERTFVHPNLRSRHYENGTKWPSDLKNVDWWTLSNCFKIVSLNREN